ncbi:MAG: redoxin domain-containing protein [Pirellulales bacterium]
MRRLIGGILGLWLLTGCGPQAGTAPAPSASQGKAVAPPQQNPPPDSSDRSTPPADASAASTTPPEDGSPAATGDGEGASLQDVVRLAQSGELAQARQRLQKMVVPEKDERPAQHLLLEINQAHAVQVLQETGEKEAAPLFLEAAAAARAFRKKFPELTDNEQQVVATTLYNGACFEAKAGDLDKAQQSLEEAVDAGFENLAQLDKDEDLVEVRKRPGFQEFRAAAEQKIMAAAKKEAAEQLAKFESFPFDFALTDVEGKERKLADYRGKVLIVDIWGTWCPPCRMEIPHFVELHGKYKEQGLEIVGINYEDGSPEEVRELVKKFIADNKMTYTCVVGDDATRERVPNFEGFPTTLFIDRTGKVRFKEVGYRPLAALDAVVSTLLAEPADAPPDSK